MKADAEFRYSICYIRRLTEQNDEPVCRPAAGEYIRHISTVADLLARLQMIAFQGPFSDWNVSVGFSNAVIINLRVKRDALTLVTSSRKDRMIISQFDIETAGGGPEENGKCVDTFVDESSAGRLEAVSEDDCSLDAELCVRYDSSTVSGGFCPMDADYEEGSATVEEASRVIVVDPNLW
jgi:hypothetical protein